VFKMLQQPLMKRGCRLLHKLVSGTLSVDYRADGPGVVAPVAGSFTAGGSLLGGSLTSNGVPVVVTLVGNQYVGKAGALSVFTLDVNADGTYSFKLLDQLDHADGSNANDVITLGLGSKPRIAMGMRQVARSR
jgi:hypothetical protein